MKMTTTNGSPTNCGNGTGQKGEASEMEVTYRKPRVIAKSAQKQSFVASCPVKAPLAYCTRLNYNCMAGNLK